MVNNWSISDANGDDNSQKSAAVINQCAPLGPERLGHSGQAFPLLVCALTIPGHRGIAATIPC